MSEAEKRKRASYIKNRKKWIFIQGVVIAVISLMIIISSIVAIQLDKTYYVEYNESGGIDYKVYLKPNEFYESQYQDKDQSYVASLIDNIIVDFNYAVNMFEDDVNYHYSYDIDAELEIIDGSSKVAIFNPVYDIKDATNKQQSSSDKLEINEIIVLDYNKYNDLANKFIDTYNLDNTTSTLVVKMAVDILSDCNAFTGENTGYYESELRIPLTSKTVNIQMSSTVPDEGSKMIACTRGVGSEAFKVTAVVLAFVDLAFILLLVAFIYLTRTQDTTYHARVKKIMSRYKSYIQRINNLFDMSLYQIVAVNSFEEMLEIHDTIQAPILVYENGDKTCSKFIIPTDNKLLYLYELRVEGYVEPKIKPKAEPVPTTIVKPNITNVVKPIVKVTVTAPAAALAPVEEPEEVIEAETVIEEPVVEIESETEEIPVVTAEIEEEPVEELPIEEEEIAEELPIEEEEIVEELPVEEEIVEEDIFLGETLPEEEQEDFGVDAIDVTWPERRHKVYRYDPDGETVEEGDIVLVPTRDVANDKEVVRQAEVSKGNYKIDPAELKHPLKKIIGVVRRKAEQAFTSLLTEEEQEPSEDKDAEN